MKPRKNSRHLWRKICAFSQNGHRLAYLHRCALESPHGLHDLLRIPDMGRLQAPHARLVILEHTRKALAQVFR